MRPITTHKQDIEAILSQYLGPKPVKEATKAINEVLVRVTLEAQAQMTQALEAAVDKIRPKAMPKTKRPKAAKAAPAAAPEPKAAKEPKAKPAPRKGTKKVSEDTYSSQKLIKEIYWAMVRYFKKEAREGDKELIMGSPEIAKEQREGAKRRAEQLLAKAAEKAKPAASAKKGKKANGVAAKPEPEPEPEEADDEIEDALNL